MIANFFQNLEAHGVAYLLISGQATILYGAATFSEDIDLWIEPSPENIERFRTALRQVRATYYKLTPPLESNYFTAGYGFHFLIGTEPGAGFFLDVLGRPPRSRAFREAARGSRRFDTEWGILPVLAMRELIELKKTQRLSDYPVISALTLRVLETSDITAETLKWAATNLFTVESFSSFNTRYPQWGQSPPENLPLSLTQFAGRAQEEIPDHVIEEAARWMSAVMARHQIADRHYWRPIINQLRQLRRDGVLMPEGAAV
jgi:hypothetical protein